MVEDNYCLLIDSLRDKVREFSWCPFSILTKHWACPPEEYPQRISASEVNENINSLTEYSHLFPRVSCYSPVPHWNRNHSVLYQSNPQYRVTPRHAIDYKANSFGNIFSSSHLDCGLREFCHAWWRGR